MKPFSGNNGTISSLFKALTWLFWAGMVFLNVVRLCYKGLPDLGFHNLDKSSVTPWLLFIMLFEPGRAYLLPKIGLRAKRIGITNRGTRPPRNAEFLFHVLMTPNNANAILGDLEERYKYLHKRFGPGRANFWYWKQTIFSLFSLALNCVGEIAGEYFQLLRDVIVHFVFLSIFAVLSLGLEYVVDHFCAHGFELLVLRAIQVVFGAATIGPTVVWLIRDINALWVGGKVKE